MVNLRSRIRSNVQQYHASLIRMKYLLLGDVHIGKTSFIKRYRYQTSSQPSLTWQNEKDKFTTTYEPTIGVDLYTSHKNMERIINDQTYQIQCNFFDLSGDLQYQRIRTEFYSDFNGILLMYDVTSRASFEHLEHFLQEIIQIKTNESLYTLKVVVCGNKIDCSKQRVITEREAKKWCSTYGYEYYEISAKTGLNINKVVESLMNVTLNDYKPQPQPAFFHTNQNQQSSSSSSTESQSQSQPRPTTASNQQSSSSTASSAPYSSNSTYSNTNNNTDTSNMSASEIRRILDHYNVSYADCFEKSDLIARYNETMTRVNTLRQEKAAAVQQKENAEKKQEELKDSIIADVDRWATSKQKDIRQMLNDIHNLTSEDNNYLDRHSAITAVEKLYKKSMLKLHPDKVDINDFAAHLRATEMFKAVNSAYEQFKKQNEKRSSTEQDYTSQTQNTSNYRQTSYATANTHTRDRNAYGNTSRPKGRTTNAWTEDRTSR